MDEDIPDDVKDDVNEDERTANRPQRRALAVVAMLAAALGSGCVYARNLTDTARSATEQLLLTESVERAVDALELPAVAGRKVALEIESLAPEDAKYLEAVTLIRLQNAGARMVPADEAELVLKMRAGALGTVSRQLLFGIPPVPVPNSITTVPGLPIYTVSKQRGYTKLRLVTYDDTGRLVAESGPVMRRASFEVYSLFLFTWYRNDIYPPEEETEAPGDFEFDVD